MPKCVLLDERGTKNAASAAFNSNNGEPGGTRFEERVPQLKKCPLEAFRPDGEPGGTRTHDTKLKRLVL